MADRGHESPMDFQWEGSGPGDPNSPFRLSTMGGSFANDSQVKKINQPLFQSSAKKAPQSPPVSQFVFSTPYNQAPHTPHSVRPPPPQPIFRTPSQPIFRTPSQPIFRTPSFTTPRHSFNTPSRDSDIFSEGTPGTPDVDSEAPTPEAPWTGRLEARGVGNRAASTTPSRVTGRGELRRGIFHDAPATKVRRRRQPQFSSRDFNTPGIGIFEDEEDEKEESNHPYSSTEDSFGHTNPHPTHQSWGRTAQSAATNWVATHRELPVIASHYIQVFFNLCLILLILYALFCFYLTIRRDVNQKVSEYSEAILADMTMCSREYTDNRCEMGEAPWMRPQCTAWGKCMNRDPSQVGRARVSAETFAEIINSFIEPISYKTMFFVLLVIFGGLFISNTAFGFYRSKPPAPYIPAPPPPTPSHWERQAQQQLHYESLPRSPVPSTPARMVGYGGGRVLGRMVGRESVRGKEVVLVKQG